MAFDLLAAGIGFGAGVIGTAIALEVALRRVKNPEQTTLTGVWALHEVWEGGEPPAIVAERIDPAVGVPEGSKLLVRSGAFLARDLVAHADVRMHPEVRTNFCIGERKGLLFTSHIHPRALVATTIDPALVGRLRSEFNRLWAEAEPYLLHAHVADLPQYEGQNVEVSGVVLDTVELRGRTVLRLVEEGHTVGVIATRPEDAELRGSAVRAAGTVVKVAGHTLLQARRLERTRLERRAGVATAPR